LHTRPRVHFSRHYVAGMILVVLIGAMTVRSPGAEGPASFPGLAYPGAPQGVLRGPDANLQLVVTVRYGSGQVRDWTGQVAYAAIPANVVRVDALSSVTPLANGKATITATGPQGLSATASVTVQDFDNPPAINFTNQVIPIFTKLGCNS